MLRHLFPVLLVIFFAAGVKAQTPATPESQPTPAASVPGTTGVGSSDPATPAPSPGLDTGHATAGTSAAGNEVLGRPGGSSSEGVPLLQQADPLQTLVQDDLDTGVDLVQRGDFSLRMGGMIQVQGAFYVGDEAAIDFDDPADKEGFRIRRARFGFGGSLASDWSYYLAVDLKDAVVASQGGDRGNEILDANVQWHRFPFARVSVGVDKVPFSAFALQSSSRLALIERPLMVSQMVPDRRVGLTLEGDWLGLEYAAGVYNGSEGVTSGNRLAGLAGAAQLQYHILGKPQSFVPDRPRVALGGGYMYDDQPSVNHHRVGGNLQVQGYRVRLRGELLWMKTVADEEPTGPTLAEGDFTRMGAAGELTGFIFRDLLQLAARYEYFQDVEDLPTFGNQQLFSGGLNLFLHRHRLKLQINYIHRDERDGPEVQNNIGFAQLQALF